MKENLLNNANTEYPFSELCETLLFYFDETLGHVPLLICPENALDDDSGKLHLIRYHPIWFLELKDETTINRIDLEYCNQMYFAKKIIIESKRVKRRAGSFPQLGEIIVLILVLPTDLDVFGGDLLNVLTKKLIDKFENTLYYVIESEIAKLEIIKTEKLINKIKKGDQIKEEIKAIINLTCEEYFSSVIKQTDATTFKLQKAISYLTFKGIDIDHIVINNQNISFSKIRLFDYNRVVQQKLGIKDQFKITSIYIINNFQEIEVLVKNNSKKEFNDLIVRITYTLEFFEKEVLNEKVEKCIPEEELLFITPVIKNTNNYLFSIIEEHSNITIFSNKIDLELIKNRPY
ncbi:MAG TPA: hypothetical protein VMV43_07810 [Candidatus Nanopelagicaceae bacterium]|nr:hypothetical protein [Candidatus Nanopelagicaceae bacterium]